MAGSARDKKLDAQRWGGNASDMRFTLPADLKESASNWMGTLEMESGPQAGRTCQVQWIPCQNPLCDCTLLSVICTPAPANPELAPAMPAPPIVLVYDVMKYQFVAAPGLRQPPEAEALMSAMAQEMTAGQMDELARFFLYQKYRQTGSANLEQLNYHFSAEAHANPTLLIGYKQVFPFGEMFVFDYLSTQWRASEYFCVNPNCGCAEVVFQFFPMESRGPNDAETLRTVLYNYSQQSFQIQQESPPGDPPAAELLAAFRQSSPNLDALARYRHGQLRYLYVQDKLRRLAKAPRRLKSKPGRNDPCPCGSGLKYKKCCEPKERSVSRPSS